MLCMLCMLFCAAGCGLPSMAVGFEGERGFERVSPADKDADVELGGTARAGEQGGVVAYMSFGSLASAASRGFYNEFRSVRLGPGVWATLGMNPPMDPKGDIGILPRFEGVSPDVEAGVASSWGSEEFGHPQAVNLWRYRATDGDLELLSRPIGPFLPDPPGQSIGSHFAGGSAGFDHVVFSFSSATPANALTLAGGTLYKWADGAVRSVGVLPAGEGGGVIDAVLGYGNPSATGQAWYPGDFAVSETGARIFFTSRSSPTDSERELYVRWDDALDPGPPVTVRVSASERTDCAGDPTCGGNNVPDPAPEAGPSGAQFGLASADGAVGVFASQARLTNDATAVPADGPGLSYGLDACVLVRCDLYRWDANAPEGQRLTDLTTADAGGGGVVGVLGGSRDASKVYFVALGVLASGAAPNQPNVYLWERDVGVRLVAKLDSTPSNLGLVMDEGTWSRSLSTGSPSNGAQDHVFGGVRVTDDGRFLLFRSQARLTPYDNAGHFMLYLFDAEDGSLVCVSCNPRVAESSEDALLRMQRSSVFQPPWLNRNVSASGRSVVFESREALVEGDSNSVADVYEWSTDGVRLVSRGIDAEDSSLLDASSSGEDVFFITRGRLVDSDEDSFVDLYDARIGGGTPGLPRQQVCLGDECQGSPSRPPGLTEPATEHLENPGKVMRKPKRKRCKKGFVERQIRGKKRCTKRKRASHKKARQGGRG